MSFSITNADRTIGRSAKILIKHDPKMVSGSAGPEEIPIQFPPKVTDDTKVANWIENDAASFEPRAIWKGSAARRITVELTYIVTGGEFNTSKISTITRQFKSYFYRSIEDGEPIPLVQLSLYDHTVGGPADFRMLDVSFSFGETLINDDSGIFPLMTKIKFSAALVTNIDGQQEIPNLRDKPPVGWY